MKKLLFALLLLAAPAQAQIVNTLPFQLQNGTTADASQVMADFNQIVNNTNSNAAKNGANSDITSLSGLTTPITPAQGGTSVYLGTAGGSANAITVTTTAPTGFSLSTGKRVVTVATNTNTGAATLNAGGTGATNIFKLSESGPVALTGGEIHAGSVLEAIYDGTQYQLVTNNLSLLGPLTNLASATSDLGTIPSHNINITGSTTIAAFGSTASTNFPIYYLTFASALTLTYNASSMILPGAADISVAAGDTAIAEYLGSGNWKIAFYLRAAGTSVVAATPLCGATGLVITNNSGTPTTQIDITADNAVMVNSGGASVYRSNVSVTINLTNTNVINGSDGARPASAWTYIYLLDNGSTTGGYASTSQTGSFSTTPTGYTYLCRLGAMALNGAQNLMRTTQVGNRGQYNVVAGGTTVALPNIATGAQGTNCNTATPTWATPTVRGNSFVAPATAPEVRLVASSVYNSGTTSMIYLAPTTEYGGGNGNAPLNQPFFSNGTNAAPTTVTQPVDLVLQGNTVAWCAAASGGGLMGNGWRDKVNAN